jgi:hypothetical protein
MTRIIDFVAPVTQKSGPGKWMDMDLLEVGNGGMNFDEYGIIPVFSEPYAELTKTQ